MWDKTAPRVFNVPVIVVVSSFYLLHVTWAGFSCMDNPCFHGICIDYLESNSTHQCYCRNGFTGYSCHINWDECKSNPCLNNGICTDGIASFNCSCPDNFAGTLCQYDLSDCDQLLPCQNNGTCTIDSSTGNDTLLCQCAPGFSGLQCELDISICNTSANVCMNGGQCEDGVGDNFHCKCEIGWAGKVCEVMTDNCKSQPCQNGGICVNKLNDFKCACPFGFTGKTCEKKLKICQVNPCKNGAFCLHEDEDDTGFTCYCVPDYHGELCEFQYDDCDPPPKCFNGGTCIDGVGEFSCSCPPEYFGPTCNCTSDNLTDPSCYVNGTSFPVLPQTVTVPAIKTTIMPLEITSVATLSTELSSPTIHELFSPSFSLYPEPKESSLNSTREEYLTLMSLPPEVSFSAKPSDTIVPSQTLTLESSGVGDLNPTVVLEGSESTILSSSIMSLLSTEIAKGDFTATLGSSEEISLIISADKTASSNVPGVSVTAFSSPLLNETWDTSIYTQENHTTTAFPLYPTPRSDLEDVSITSGILPASARQLDSGLGKSSSAYLFSAISLYSLNATFVMETLVVVPTASLSATDKYASTLDLLQPTISYEFSTVELGSEKVTLLESGLSTTSKVPLPNATPTIEPSFSSYYGEIDSVSLSQTLTPVISISMPLPPPLSSSLLSSSPLWEESFSSSMGYSEEIWSASVMPTASATDGSLFISEVLMPDKTRSVDEAGPGGGWSTSSFGYHSTRTIPDASVSPMPSSSTPETNTSSTTSPSSEVSPSPSTPRNNESQYDLCRDFCQNDGKCIADIFEPSCICPFKFTGKRCESPRQKFTTASFTGDSFLEYKVPNNSINKIHMKTVMATSAPHGILFYTSSSLGRLYALIFVQDGHITLHFSCGAQSMHFVETRMRVDNGFNFTLEYSMGMIIHSQGDSEVRCVGELNVNQSYIMKGEQIVRHGELYENPITFIYLGGVESDNARKSDNLVGILQGFVGCLYSLWINDEEKDIFDDAIDGKSVSECAVFGCVTSPCFGGSTCVPSNTFPYWQCNCSPGFQGVRCQIRVCDSNPCLNGATCAYVVDDSHSGLNQNHTSKYVCLCHFGFTGRQCQLQLNITKPSFKPTSGYDYSAYISYEPIPRFADWMQLKLHFVLRNTSQIALLLYSGHSQSYHENAVTNPDEIDALAELVNESQQQPNAQSLAETSVNLYNGPQMPTISDFFAITYVQGYVALTWNLGSGTQRIITPGRIDKRLNVHSIYAGRSGRQAWLKVDGMKNVTGRSPGPFHRLNVNTELFVGGYESFQFEGLPHDLPMHKGFEGCIFDLGFRKKNRLYLPRALRGRNVKNCYEEEEDC